MTQTVAEPKEEFVTLLKRHRIAAGFSQSAIARRLKVQPSTVCHWEAGDTLPSPKFIPKLAVLLGIDPMTLTRVIEPELAVGGNGRA